MKLPKAFAFSFLVLVALAGCNRLPDFNDRVVIVNEDITEMTGVIEAKELDLYTLGTHQIRTSDDKTFPIQSQTINLSNYLEKDVSIRGKLEASPLDKSKKVFTVNEIALIGEDFGEGKDYSNKTLGFSINYPGNWELIESNDSLVFKANGKKQIRVDVFPLSGTVDEFVNVAEEGIAGTPVTVGAQRSLRFIDESIRVYVPNYSKKKVYLISFDRLEGNEAEDDFYSMLESFSVIYTKRKTGARCAGAAKLECPEGFRCELNSNEEDSAGVCIDVSESDSNLDCPFVPKPENCNVYQVQSVSKDGCPTSYICMDKIENNDLVLSDKDRVKETFVKYQSKILGDFGAKVVSMEVDESQRFLIVSFTDEEGGHTVTYRYSPSGSEFNFVEKSRTDDAPDTANVSAEEPAPAKENALSADFRLYENSYHNFSIGYYKNWYYQSFGSKDGSILVVGFAEKPLNGLSDSLVTVGINEGAISAKSSNAGGETYEVLTPRNTENHFFIRGPSDLKDTIDTMADSIVQN